MSTPTSIGIFNCTLEVQCPKGWDVMTPTAQEGVRHCATCRRDVHWANNARELNALARRGECAALRLSSSTPDAKRERIVVGLFVPDDGDGPVF
jgi:hypothetical protein